MTCVVCGGEKTILVAAASAMCAGAVEHVFDCPECTRPQRLAEFEAEIDRYVTVKRAPNVIVLRISA